MESTSNSDSGIILAGCDRISSLMKNILTRRELERIRFINCYFDETVSLATKLKEENSIKILIAGGSNYGILKNIIPDFPLIPLNVSVTDLFQALKKANSKGSQSILITSRHFPINIEDYKELFRNKINSVTYSSKSDLKAIMRDLSRDTEIVVIGASLACDYADQYGIPNVFIYSERSVMESVERAFQIQNSTRAEERKSKLLNAIIDFTSSGIMAINEDRRITVCNPVAEKVLGLQKNEVLNKKIRDVIHNTRLEAVFESGELELNQVQKIMNDKVILTNRIPIIVDGSIVGVVATFHDIEDLKEVEVVIRRELNNKGFVSKYIFKDILGKSRSIKASKELAKIYSNNDSTILIYGETGTGKELFAHSIHNLSNRRNKPFIALNCAALAESLLESELFGYEEGTFTGAKKGGKAGVFELAHGGTLFLDEISEMPLRLQTQILRTLQEKEIRKIGGQKIIPIDVRVIAATNRKLEEEVEKGLFRRDLYYRLNILYVEIPALRERTEDIPVLVEMMVKKNSPELFEKSKSIWDDFVSYFADYAWPGNVRELDNLVKRTCAILLTHGINKKLMFDIWKRAIGINQPTSKVISKTKKVGDALKEVEGNRNRAAEILGVSRTTLWRRMKKMKDEQRKLEQDKTVPLP